MPIVGGQVAQKQRIYALDVPSFLRLEGPLAVCTESDHGLALEDLESARLSPSHSWHGAANAWRTSLGAEALYHAMLNEA